VEFSSRQAGDGLRIGRRAGDGTHIGGGLPVADRGHALEVAAGDAVELEREGVAADAEQPRGELVDRVVGSRQ